MTTAHVHTVSVVSFSFVLLHHELTSLFAIFDITFWYFLVFYCFLWFSMDKYGFRWTVVLLGSAAGSVSPCA